jgi:methionyl-tRNA formyltransferase
MRLAYLGTPAMAVPPLEALVAAGHDVALVVTRADTRRGRGGATSPSPVKIAAGRLGIPVTDRIDDVVDMVDMVDDVGAGVELGVVVAFGRIIRPHVLDALAMVNLHFSLLPRWRGAAPVERAILAGDEVTGVCVMAVEEGLDTGPVYARADVPIGPSTTAAELRDELVRVGTGLLVGVLSNGLDGLPEPAPQVGAATYAAKIEPAELRLDWARPAAELDRIVRVGGAWTTFRGSRVKVLAGHVDGDRYVPARLQPEGRGPVAFDAWRNGARLAPGEWFE